MEDKKHEWRNFLKWTKKKKPSKKTFFFLCRNSTMDSSDTERPAVGLEPMPFWKLGNNTNHFSTYRPPENSDKNG